MSLINRDFYFLFDALLKNLYIDLDYTSTTKKLTINLRFGEKYIATQSVTLDEENTKSLSKSDFYGKTLCKKCGEIFELNRSTVYLGCKMNPPHCNVAVIKCPHCYNREEM